MIKYLNLVFFTGMIVMNYLANALPLNNRTTGELSDSYPNLFVPAGLTFSIWGVIYLLLAWYCILQFTSANQKVILNISWLFAISCILNALWIIAWHYVRLPLSLLLMVGLLVTLIYINIMIRHLPIGVIKAAFGIYLGWICIATIANVTALLVHYNWNGWGVSDQTWTIIMILTGALIISLTVFRVNNAFIGLAAAWAFTGILLKRQHDYEVIALIAALAIIFVGIVTVWIFFRKVAAIV
jgi:tryptophan-rich sensory protein